MLFTHRSFATLAGNLALCCVAIFGLSGISFADTIRTWEFMGTVGAGTIDTAGQFGPVGGNIGGDPFLAVVSVDLTTANMNPYGNSIGGEFIFTAPTLSQLLTVNGATVNEGNSAQITSDFVAEDTYSFTGGVFNLNISGEEPFPIFSQPGYFDLTCTGNMVTSRCATIFDRVAFSGVPGSATILSALTITDTTAPVPLPSSLVFLLSGLFGLGVFRVKNRSISGPSDRAKAVV